MTNPSSEQGRSNGKGGNIFGGIVKIFIIIFVLSVIGVFLGLFPIPGKVTPEPGASISVPMPGPTDLNLVRLQPEQEVAILRTGLMLPYVTENCDSPVSTKETITHERVYALSIELDIAESYASDIERALTGGATDITQVELAIAEGIAREMSKSLGIRTNESIRVESSREIETPAGYRSAVSLQWEEAHTIGIATIRTGSGAEFNIPFSYVSHMHLAQVGTVYTSCADGTKVTSSSGGIPVLPSAGSSHNPTQIVSPVNTECKNPVTFTWNNEPKRQYKVTARSLGGDALAGVESNWIEGGTWEIGLPANLWGSWEWFITRDDNLRSDPAVFVFNPFPTSNKDEGCSATRAHALNDLELTSSSYPSATPIISEAEDTNAPVDQPILGVFGGEELPTQDPNAAQSPPTATFTITPTDPASPPYPPPTPYPDVPTPEIIPTTGTNIGYPNPPPTPYVYP